MPFQNKNRNQTAYLTALTLLFSYAEMLLPHIIPFFRLGLGNIVILAALGLPFHSFLLLTILKALAASLMAGTLFSPFLLVSLAQSVSSGILMYGAFHLNRIFRNRLFSVYGISVAGSALSAAVQIWLCSLYLGAGTEKLLGPMLIFNTISGIITAALYTVLELNSFCEGGCVPLASSGEVSAGSTTPYSATPSAGTSRNALTALFLALGILVAAAAVFFIKFIPALVAAMCIALVLQKISGRKILLLPYISLWIFVLASAVFVPEGKVLFSLGSFSLTEGALLSGLEKALKLSAVSALSQCAASLRPSENTLIGMSLAIYRNMLDTMHSSSGNVFERLKKAIQPQ